MKGLFLWMMLLVNWFSLNAFFDYRLVVLRSITIGPPAPLYIMALYEPHCLRGSSEASFHLPHQLQGPFQSASPTSEAAQNTI